jgi:hypothetical protein
MLMKTVCVTITVEMYMQYDPESPAFQDTMASYKDVINADAHEDMVIEQAALQVWKHGLNRMHEGIGYVHRVGRLPSEPSSGIFCQDEDPDVDIYSCDLDFDASTIF